MQHRYARRAAVAAGALTLILAACGQGDDPTMDAPQGGSTTEPQGGSATEETAANQVDVMFLQGMIPHHEGATEMAALVPDRTDRPELIELSETIISSQEAEIEQMREMLDRLDAEEMSMDEMDEMDGMDAMGMMSSTDMSELESADGEEFERLFIDGMIGHHQGAIEMSDMVLAEGSDDEVAALAESIIAAQEAEIEQMST
jgi:uncharacterized protein (DUF305 family)